jgi:hypothetical protein
MVGAAYSFVKLVVRWFVFKGFAPGHDIRAAAIGRLTGYSLRVSMPGVVLTPQFSILI